MYLKRDNVAAILRLIGERAATGSVVTFDFLTDRYLRSGPATALYGAAMKPLMKYVGESIRFTLDGTPPLRERLAAFLAEQRLMIGDFRALGSGSPEKPAFAGVVVAFVPPR